MTATSPLAGRPAAGGDGEGIRINLHADATGNTLVVKPGEMVVLTGPPGSGTSAALRALAGQSSWREHGTAQIGGITLAALTHRQRRRAAQKFRLFYLPHAPALISNLTVMENILLPLCFMGELSESEGTREIRVLLDAAGVGWTAGLLPSRLGPEAVKTVALIRGFIRRPEAALLDDPFSDLDETGMAGIVPMIRSTLSDSHCAILAVSRDLTHFESLDHRREEITQLLGRRHVGEESSH
jgi:putative ABC transport system ATP-binding protein